MQHDGIIKDMKQASACFLYPGTLFNLTEVTDGILIFLKHQDSKS